MIRTKKSTNIHYLGLKLVTENSAIYLFSSDVKALFPRAIQSETSIRSDSASVSLCRVQLQSQLNQVNLTI